MPAPPNAAGILPRRTATSSIPSLRPSISTSTPPTSPPITSLARAEYGRAIRVWALATVVQGETEQEARRSTTIMSTRRRSGPPPAMSSPPWRAEVNERNYPPERARAMAEMFVSGWGGHPLIGTRSRSSTASRCLAHGPRRRLAVVAALRGRHAGVPGRDLSAAAAGGALVRRARARTPRERLRSRHARGPAPPRLRRLARRRRRRRAGRGDDREPERELLHQRDQVQERQRVAVGRDRCSSSAARQTSRRRSAARR